jgi:hypothetical protein
MNLIVPFKKDIKFETAIGEITSISLEHEQTVNQGSLLGNFILSGEYKAHEVSVNTQPFNYTVPFDVEIPTNVDIETINFDIDNFTYEIEKPDILKVNIDYRVIGDEKAEELNSEKQSENIQEVNDEIAEIREEEPTQKVPELIEEPKIEVKEQVTELKEEKIDNRVVDSESEKSIMNLASSSEDVFVTYHIHVIKDGENVESICKLYNISSDSLGEYNNLKEINTGVKLVIPVDE